MLTSLPDPVRRDSISAPKGNVKSSVSLTGPPLSPSASKEAKEEFRVNQLICAFEAAFIKNPRADLSVMDQVRILSFSAFSTEIER